MTAAVKPKPPCLLTDRQIWSFIVHGFLVIESERPDSWWTKVLRAVRQLTDDDRRDVASALPQVLEAFDSPRLRGTLQSLLGMDFRLHPHCQVHETAPGDTAQAWHQDFTRQPGYALDTLIVMFYPERVTADMGPTVVMPGTHFRSAENDQLATYTNIEGQVPLIVEAGSCALMHRALWHAATANRSATPRLMLKFLAERTSAPSIPSWDHDAAAGERARHEFMAAPIGGLGWCTDYRLEWEQRWSMWAWLRGRPPGECVRVAKDLIY